MNRRIKTRVSLKVLLGNLVLIAFGVSIALGVAELTLRLNPSWVPREVRVNPPVRRIKASKDITFEIRLSDGDLFYWMRGLIAPLPTEEDKVVANVHLVTDADGFRNFPPAKSHYDIVALGDSFTNAQTVATPWPQGLAEYLGTDVFNLGEAGSGPQQQQDILRRYGIKKQPQWVILAYFEGNDLYDAGSYELANPLLLARVGKYFLNRITNSLNNDTQSDADLPTGSAVGGSSEISPNYQYPIALTINKNSLEMAFFSYYVSWLTIDGRIIESSKNFQLVKETIQETREISEAVGACFLMVYIPSAPHVYLPYIQDTGTMASVFTDVPVIVLDEAGYLQFGNQRATSEMAGQYMGDQADLLAGFTAENSINYLDLTPIFQGEAGKGVDLYYPYDTHWNQNGHDLAAQTISAYIENTPEFLANGEKCE